MPVVLTERISEDEILGIWHIGESADDLLSRLHATPWLDNMMEGVTHPVKQMEYLASRFLLEHLAQQMNLPFQGIFKDTHGKPHPVGGGFYLSWSHAYPYAACCIHTKKPVGIDIERPREQLARVGRKYLNEQEAALAQTDDLQTLCIIWAAKEAIFKMNGRNGLSLKDDITIVSIKNTEKVVLARAHINGNIENITIDFFPLEGHWVAFTR